MPPVLRQIALVLAVFLLPSCAHAPAPVPSQETQRALWLEPLRLSDAPVVRFRDELSPVEDAIARALSRRHQVMANAELRKLRKDVLQGSLPNLAQQCPAPPPPAWLTEVVYPEALRASPSVECEHEMCSLLVVVEAPSEPTAQAPRDYQEVERYTARFPARETPEQWAARIDRDGLAPTQPPPAAMGGLGVIGGIVGENDPEGMLVRVHDLELSGGWTSKLDRALLQTKTHEFGACEHNATWQDWYGMQFVLAIDAGGHATRCEPALADHVPPPEFACQCGVLSQVDFGPGGADRRAQFSLYVVDAKHLGDVVSQAYLSNGDADDPYVYLGRGGVNTHVLSACVQELKEPMDLELSVQFQVGPDGRAVSEHVDWPATLPASVTQCLDGALSGAQFNCPLHGKSALQVGLFISVLKVARRR